MNWINIKKQQIEFKATSRNWCCHFWIFIFFSLASLSAFLGFLRKKTKKAYITPKVVLKKYHKNFEEKSRGSKLHGGKNGKQLKKKEILIWSLTAQNLRKHTEIFYFTLTLQINISKKDWRKLRKWLEIFVGIAHKLVNYLKYHNTLRPCPREYSVFRSQEE